VHGALQRTTLAELVAFNARADALPGGSAADAPSPADPAVVPAAVADAEALRVIPA